MSPCELISCVDTAWLRMDRPNNLMQIVGVLMFDGQLDEAQLRTSLEYTIRVQPRFHQKASLEGGSTTGVTIPISISICTSSG